MGQQTQGSTAVLDQGAEYEGSDRDITFGYAPVCVRFWTETHSNAAIITIMMPFGPIANGGTDVAFGKAMPKPTASYGRTVTLIVGIMVALIIVISAFLLNRSDTSSPQSSSPDQKHSQTIELLDTFKSGAKEVALFIKPY